MRIIVTGGAGFIGSHIADAFVKEQHDVLVIDDLSNGKRENVPTSAKFIKADIRDATAIQKIFDEFKPNVVCHQAAQTSVSVSTREPVRDAEINIIGSLNIISQCVRCGVERIIFASTGGAIYGEVPEGERATIDWKPMPLSPYACSKLAVEGYLFAYQKEHGLRFTVLRYANVYGPRQDPHGEAGVVAIFINNLSRGESIQINARKTTGDPGGIRDYVFVNDVVRANLFALKGDVTVPILNVCTGTPTSTMQLARLIEKSIPIRADIRFAPRRAGDIECSVLETNQPELLTPTTPLERGIQETVGWFRRS
jgi:UDP-glucose 4-epimerase